MDQYKLYYWTIPESTTWTSLIPLKSIRDLVVYSEPIEIMENLF